MRCSDFLQAQVKAIGDALEPVRDWYSGEFEDRPLVDILTDAVTDLQADRSDNIDMHQLLKRYHESHSRLAVAQADPSMHPPTHCECRTCRIYRGMRDKGRAAVRVIG